MNWDAIGAIGEILGAVAVVISVFYLAIQIRQNTKSMQASAERELSLGFTTSGMTLASTQIPFLVVKASKDVSQLTEEEIAQFGFWINGALRNWEGAYLQYQGGYISEESWEALYQQIRMFMQSDGVQKYWNLRKTTFRADFTLLLDNIDLDDSPLASDKMMNAMLDRDRREDH